MVLAVVIVFMVGSLAVDVGFWYLDHRTAQNQVDAAVQAAMLKMPDPDDAEDAADEALSSNGSDLSLASGSCNAGSMTGSTTGARIEFPSSTSVKVCLRRASINLLSTLFGLGTPYVSASAKASGIAGSAPFTIMALNKGNVCPGLLVAGNGNINITGGSVYVGGTCSSTSNGTLQVNGSNANLSVPGGSIYVVDAVPPRSGTGSMTPATPQTTATLADPMAAFAGSKPPVETCKTAAQVSSSTWLPGTYCGAINVTSNKTLATGVYVFTGAVTVTATISGPTTGAKDVLLFGTSTSSFGFSGNSGRLQITGHSSYGRMLMWLDATGTSCSTGNIVSFTGQASAVGSSGVIYAPNSAINFAGQGVGSADVSLLGNIVCLSGNGTFGGSWIQVPGFGATEYSISE